MQNLFDSIFNIPDPTLQFVSFDFQFIFPVLGVQHKFCIFDDFLFHSRASLISEYATQRQTQRTIQAFAGFDWILDVIVIEQLILFSFNWYPNDVVGIWKNGQFSQW